MDKNEQINKIKEIIKEGDDKSKGVKISKYLLFGRWNILTKITFADRRSNWIKST